MIILHINRDLFIILQIQHEITLSRVDINWYVYILDTNGPQNDGFEDQSGEEINLSTQWVLPSADMSNLWETLIYDTNIKQNVLKSPLFFFSN